jgi:hypothetical protein
MWSALCSTNSKYLESDVPSSSPCIVEGIQCCRQWQVRFPTTIGGLLVNNAVQLVYRGLTLLDGATVVNKATVIDLPAINIELVINDARLVLMVSAKVVDGILLRWDVKQDQVTYKLRALVCGKGFCEALAFVNLSLISLKKPPYTRSCSFFITKALSFQLFHSVIQSSMLLKNGKLLSGGYDVAPNATAHWSSTLKKPSSLPPGSMILPRYLKASQGSPHQDFGQNGT